MAPPRAPWRKAVRPLIVVAVLGLLFFVAQALRAEIGLEWSSESIRATVRRLGIWAPAGFVTLVVFRQFMALPSVLVLTSAGLLFGTTMGALLGGLGITLNGLALFASARLLGGDWALPRLHAMFPEFEQRAKAAGPLVLAFMTGHPMGVLTPFHLGAGMTGIGWGTFLLAVAPAALFRASCYAFLGAYLLQPGSREFWLATAFLLLAALLPLAHPGLRARLLRRPEPAEAQVDVSR